jgi:DtxR family transcriptional regulator, Mn-dependent transcriptional regulator
MNSFTEENYLKAIYKLSEEGRDEITTNDIARTLGTSAASVTDMLKKLSKKNLVNYKKYQGVKMSGEGTRTALSIIRKHRLWEMFLVKVLKFKWDEVHELAEQLEHIRSEKLIQHIDKLLDFPKFDPHGDPIPDGNGKFVVSKEKPFLLSEAKEGKKYVVIGVVDHSSAFLQLLDKSGIELGSRMRIMTVQPYDRSFSVLLNGRKRLYISRQIAKNILVSTSFRG